MRVLIAEDHPMVRRCVRDIIETCSEWEVCAETGDGSEVARLAVETAPDVAVVDLSLPGAGGLEVTRRLKQTLARVEVIILTMNDDKEMVESGLAAGARGYLLKTDAEQHLASAITAVALGKRYLSPFVSDQFTSEGEPSERR